MIPDSGLELRHLRTFVAVAERRSFTLAAEDLHVAQQAVSQQIKALERSLGVSLLRRTPRRVDLTSEGAVFLGDCVWPREMAPGFYDTVVGTCRTAGFEPMLDEQATGNIVWGNLASGRGVALINASLQAQLPRGAALGELAEPRTTLTYDAVWQEDKHPLIQRTLDVAARLAKEADWL